jgi:hypothetical protein
LLDANLLHHLLLDHLLLHVLLLDDFLHNLLLDHLLDHDRLHNLLDVDLLHGLNRQHDLRHGLSVDLLNDRLSAVVARPTGHAGQQSQEHGKHETVHDSSPCY